MSSSDKQPSSKGGPQSIYITSLVGGGKVLAAEESGTPSGVVTEKRAADGNDDRQKWLVEYGDEGTVALKSVANGKYLNAAKIKLAGEVGTGDKQWWTVSPPNPEVTTPAVYRLVAGEDGGREYVLYNHNWDNSKKIRVNLWESYVRYCIPNHTGAELSADSSMTGQQCLFSIVVLHRYRRSRLWLWALEFFSDKWSISGRHRCEVERIGRARSCFGEERQGTVHQ